MRHWIARLLYYIGLACLAVIFGAAIGYLATPFWHWYTQLLAGWGFW